MKLEYDESDKEIIFHSLNGRVLLPVEKLHQFDTLCGTSKMIWQYVVILKNKAQVSFLITDANVENVDEMLLRHAEHIQFPAY